MQDRIGATGTIVGIDKSPEMLQQARRHAERSGWKNVILIQADMVLVRLSGGRVGVVDLQEPKDGGVGLLPWRVWLVRWAVPTSMPPRGGRLRMSAAM
ncbi:methyltransferase domain-containing protein [Arthrobacter sp. H35-D1]|uniref:methyltransferase domain-containing protein n=1 Tax=Arthrobacter sp. H35-D1 TaxID=3046202 RepID=UPI0024BAED26|nr:methyltransferase domain-containing protein [Arthrobacter sp. H35-D1]MDJ0313667.1 methyltransferase domain-containing protein [Arthrobacter sp. H35-D1]